MSNRNIWMTFVDGENLTMRAQDVAAQNGLKLSEGEYFKRDCFVWLPKINGKYPLIKEPTLLGTLAIRASYYTSVYGDEALIKEVRQALWNLAFDGHVFKKTRREEKAKGVDIALTKDML